MKETSVFSTSSESLSEYEKVVISLTIVKSKQLEGTFCLRTSLSALDTLPISV